MVVVPAGRSTDIRKLAIQPATAYHDVSVPLDGIYFNTTDFTRKSKMLARLKLIFHNAVQIHIQVVC